MNIIYLYQFNSVSSASFYYFRCFTLWKNNFKFRLLSVVHILRWTCMTLLIN